MFTSVLWRSTLLILYSSQTEWNLVFALIRNTMKQPAAVRIAFDLILSLVSDGPDQCVTIDNFAGLVGVLDEFAVSANQALEMNGGQRDRRKSGESPLDAIVKRGQQSVDLVFEMRRFISHFESAKVPSENSKHIAYRRLLLFDMAFSLETMLLASSLGSGKAVNKCISRNSTYRPNKPSATPAGSATHPKTWGGSFRNCL